MLEMTIPPKVALITGVTGQDGLSMMRAHIPAFQPHRDLPCKPYA